jgi:hypothetical protein
MATAVTLLGCGVLHGRPDGPKGAAALPAPEVVSRDLEVGSLLGDLPSRALRLGAGAASLVASGPVVDNGWIGGFIMVPANVCLLAYARGSTSIEDVDVAVYSDEGTALAVDEGRDVHPTVLLCPPHSDRVYATAHVVEGEGIVAVGAQLVPLERASIVAHALGARGAVADNPRAADVWPGLEEAVRSHRQALGGKWEEFRREAVSLDARLPTYAAMPIQPDGCIDAVIVPAEDVALLDVEALDDVGRVVARAKDGTGTRSLTICSPVAVAGTFSIRPHVGRGLAALVLARATGERGEGLSGRPEIAWVAPVQPLETERNARNALLAKRGYAPPVSASSGSLVIGRRISIPLDLRSLGGRCGRVDVVAGSPLALVEARVWSNDGALLASGDASSSVALFVCATGVARLELEARGRAGPFALLVRPEPASDAAFAAHPLAASRMLARVARGPDSMLMGKDVGARELTLDGAKTVPWTATVPAGACLRVALGVEGPGAGVEVRAFDDGDVEVDRSEAPFAAAVRACAKQDGPRAIRFEARASAGHLEAVVGERLEPVDGS